ncbi:predicted protein [Nematostella vectensis]|uniref:Uncharacterized protein n=1 Tax=Nematostella vectensis TaxID=45351 RepID=A7S090_NEMVE|nr:predicted protein [Nematostella vectensis]|eukprot:XP_001634984.1 predicted protein [Nematostella vectensis]
MAADRAVRQYDTRKALRTHVKIWIFLLLVEDSRPRPLYPPRFVPLSWLLPGGDGVSYLSYLSEGFGKDLSTRISSVGDVVSAVGDSIQETGTERSHDVDRISDIVGSDMYPRGPWDAQETEDENTPGED